MREAAFVIGSLGLAATLARGQGNTPRNIDEEGFHEGPVNRAEEAEGGDPTDEETPT